MVGSTHPPSPGPQRLRRAVVLLLAAAFTNACGGAAIPEPTAVASNTPEGVWDDLLRERPTPLEGAVRIALSDFELPDGAWPLRGELTLSESLQELVGAGLLRRRDVRFVERRRFAAAVERERRGLPALRGAPEIGESSNAEFILAGGWSPGGGSATIDLRLINANTADITVAWRASTEPTADPVGLARVVVGSLITQLEEMGRLPAWSDPLSEGGPPLIDGYVPSGVSGPALASFFRGVQAEDRYAWEGARRAYQAALDLSGTGFVEARVAIERIARLRAGGTLGATD